jgi:hypothetical protein
MRDKPGYARLTIYVPRQHYDRLVRRKLLLGQSISQSVEEALERDESAAPESDRTGAARATHRPIARIRQ